MEFRLTIGIRYFLRLNLSYPFNDDIAPEKKYPNDTLALIKYYFKFKTLL